MSYLGNDPEVNAFTIGVDKFNGTGACTQFTLTRSISDANAIEVVVNGVQQEPTAAYTVTNGVVTFDEAPSSGTNNIVVTYRAPIVVTFNQVTASQLQANSVTTTALASNSVTTTKIAEGSVTSPKIATGTITGNLLGIGAVSGNNLGIGSISANNFAGGGITSNVLASNLIISVSRTLETATLNTTAIGGTGNVNIDVVNNTVYLFTSAATANIQFNLRANSTHSYDAVTNVGQTTSVAIAVRGQTNRYTANLMIDNVRQTLVFAGNGRPSFTSTGLLPGEYNVFTYSVFKTGSATYTVFSSNTLFGTA
jgi:hypothetical protein